MSRYTGFTDSAKALVLARSGGSCEALIRGCRHTGTDLHHRVNRGMGCAERSGGASAALLLCTSCHRWITEHPADAYVHGWSVRRNQLAAPSEVPVRWRGRWVLLDDSGGLRSCERPAA